MKKLLFAMLMLIAGTGVFAQTSPKIDSARKSSAKAAHAAKTNAAGPTKKDGTADMRYKANKDAKPAPAGPLKKDGSADMRYKANKGTKDTTKKKSS